MARRRGRRPTLVTMSCRRGCGKTLSTLSAPIHSTREDHARYHGICDDCLTDEERKDMDGPMLMRTAANIVGRVSRAG